MEIIQSKTNRLIKDMKKLHQKKYRKQSYLIEGWHLVEEALAAQAPIEQLLVTEEGLDRLDPQLPIRLVTPEVLSEVADSPSPQGVIAQIALHPEPVPDHLEGRYLLLEDVQDPGNVGTMIRTADAAGLDGVFLSDKSADLYNMKVLRSMQGSHFHLPVYRVELEEILDRFQASGLQVFATTLSEHSVDYRSLTLPSSYVLAMGNEGQGISETLAERADQLVHIPMPGQAESLNVAIACGILLFHFLP